jgi:peptidyl-prolyl cis-trans isomerase B (cyclophilin B)
LPAVPRLLAVLIASLALAAAGCGSSSDNEKSGDSGAADATATATATDTAAATDTPAAGDNQVLPKGCESVSQPKAKDVGKLAKPTEKLDKAKNYVATVQTSCGDFDIQLDAKRAPITGGNFKYLADKHFFDGLSFHRIVPDFVIQGGDPAGDGSGGPGYSVVEAPPSDLKYTPGIVAMAKTGAEAAGTSGSQFFVVTGASAAQLTPDYALLGKVTRGMDVVDKIGKIQADPNTGAPAAQVVIKSISVNEQG